MNFKNLRIGETVVAAATEKMRVSDFIPIVKAKMRALTTSQSVYVNTADKGSVSGSMHAPQFDNFDYTRYLLFDVATKHSTDPQAGLKMHDAKQVDLSDGKILFTFDSLKKKYLSLICNEKTLRIIQGAYTQQPSQQQTPEDMKIEINSILQDLQKLQQRINKVVQKSPSPYFIDVMTNIASAEKLLQKRVTDL